MMTMTEIDGVTADPRSISRVETAKLVRAALKRAFPGQKFSVRSSSYSGGASIDVAWTDGPAGRDVDAAVGIFSGADFDGMIDLKTYIRHWLSPDGTVTIAHAYGTEGSGGYLPTVYGDPPHPQAELVRFGVDFVQTHRRISPEWRADLEAEIAAATGQPYDPNARVEQPLRICPDPEDGSYNGRCWTTPEYGSSVIHQLSGGRSRP